MRLKHSWNRFLASLPPSDRRPLLATEKARHIVQYFYYFLLFHAVSTLPAWDFDLQRGDFSPVWSVAWANLFEYEVAVNILRFFFLGSALIGAFWYRHAFARFLAFLGIAQFHAFESSFSAINHQWYLWVYVALIFVFLPDIWGEGMRDAKKRSRFLLVFWGAQAFVLLTYTMSGIGKIFDAGYQMAANQAHAFLPEAFSLHVAYWMDAAQTTTLLGPFIVNNPFVAWPFFLGSMYLLSLSFVAAFRPSLHKLWAFGLILFHLGTFLAMKILFVPPVLLLLILFFDSPFADPKTSFRKTLFSLPLVGELLFLVSPKKR